MSGRTTQAADHSGATVFAEARKRLDDSPTVPGTVRLYVEDGIVTLTGTVQRPSQRVEAEQLVQPVIGRRRLVNNITVIPVPSAESLEAPDDRR